MPTKANLKHLMDSRLHLLQVVKTSEMFMKKSKVSLSRPSLGSCSHVTLVNQEYPGNA